MAFKAHKPQEARVNYSGRGRPPLDIMSAELVEPLVEYLGEGMGFKEACHLVGVSPTSVRRWVNAGQHDLDNGRDTANAEFAYRVTQAMAEAKRTRINALNRAAENPAFWAAAAWWLERRYPQEFGRQDRVNMNLTGNLNLGKAAGIEVSEDEADAIRNVLARVGAIQDSDSQEDPLGFESSYENGDLPLS